MKDKKTVESRQLAVGSQENDQELRAEIYKMVGRIQTSLYFEKTAQMSNLLFYNQVKESGIYKQIPEIKTWENFCKLTPYSKGHVDRLLRDVNVFGQEFLNIMSQIGIRPNGYRKLLKLPESEIKKLTDGSEVNLSDPDDVKDTIEDLITIADTAQIELQKTREKAVKKYGDLHDDCLDLERQKTKLQKENETLKGEVKTPQDLLDRIAIARRHFHDGLKILHHLPFEIIKDDPATMATIDGDVKVLENVLNNVISKMLGPDDY